VLSIYTYQSIEEVDERCLKVASLLLLELKIRTIEKEALSEYVEMSERSEGKIGMLVSRTTLPEGVGTEYSALFKALSGKEGGIFPIDSRF
jgi:hypothetical protein